MTKVNVIGGENIFYWLQIKMETTEARNRFLGCIFHTKITYLASRT